MKKAGAEGDQVRRFLSEQPTALLRILQFIMSLVMSGEFSSTW